MPEFKYPLANGKTLILEGETEPSPADVESAAKEQGVELAKMKAAAAPGLVEGGLRAVPGIVQDMSRGALKSVGGAVVGAGQMVHKIPGVTSAVDALYGQPGLSDAAFKMARAEMTPTNTAQKIGKFGGDAAMLALAPETGSLGGLASTATANPLVEAVLKNMLVSGAQTGGDPTAMATTGAATGAGYGLGKMMTKGANALRVGQAERVSDPMLESAYKDYGGVDPATRIDYRQRFADLIKQFGLSGGAKDSAAIASAPEGRQEVLTALSKQLAKPKQFGHIWSTLATLSELPALATGHGAEGLGIALPLMGMGVANKYPAQTATALDTMAPWMAHLVRSLVGSGATTATSPSPEQER